MQSPAACALHPGCIGPPAPKDGDIRMTRRDGIRQFIIDPIGKVPDLLRG
jgi:hypothetical protein